MIANLCMLLVIAIMTVLYFWMIRAELIKKLVVLVFVLFYAATQYLLVNLVTRLFPGSLLSDVYPPLTLALYAGTAVVFFLLVVVFMDRAVWDYHVEIEMENHTDDLRFQTGRTVSRLLVAAHPASVIGGDNTWYFLLDTVPRICQEKEEYIP